MGSHRGGCGYILRQRSPGGPVCASAFPGLDEKPCDGPLRIIIFFAYATKCSVFGETALSGSGVAAAALLVCAFILITGALTAMVYVLARGQK